MSPSPLVCITSVLQPLLVYRFNMVKVNRHSCRYRPASFHFKVCRPERAGSWTCRCAQAQSTHNTHNGMNASGVDKVNRVCLCRQHKETLTLHYTASGIGPAADQACWAVLNAGIALGKRRGCCSCADNSLMRSGKTLSALVVLLRFGCRQSNTRLSRRVSACCGPWHVQQQLPVQVREGDSGSRQHLVTADQHAVLRQHRVALEEVGALQTNMRAQPFYTGVHERRVAVQ